MASKEMRTGNNRFRVTAHQEGKERWVDVPACRLEDDCDVVDLQELLAKTLAFLDGDGEFDDLEEVV